MRENVTDWSLPSDSGKFRPARWFTWVSCSSLILVSSEATGWLLDYRFVCWELINVVFIVNVVFIIAFFVHFFWFHARTRRCSPVKRASSCKTQLLLDYFNRGNCPVPWLLFVLYYCKYSVHEGHLCDIERDVEK